MEQAGNVWAPGPRGPPPPAAPGPAAADPHSWPRPCSRQVLGAPPLVGSHVSRHGLATEPRPPCGALDGAWGAPGVQARAPGAARLPGALTHSVEEAWAAHQATGPGGQAVG